MTNKKSRARIARNLRHLGFLWAQAHRIARLLAQSQGDWGALAREHDWLVREEHMWFNPSSRLWEEDEFGGEFYIIAPRGGIVSISKVL